MGFFRERRRARAEAAREQQQRLEADRSVNGQDAMMSEEAALAAEARRMMLGDDEVLYPDDDNMGTNDRSGPSAHPTTTLSADQEQKVMALHYRFDADRDGYLSYNELQNLQQTTSGAAMSVHEYTMICHALQCEPRHGISLDALRVTYASAQGEGGEANLDMDYDNVFGRGGASGTDLPPLGYYAHNNASSSMAPPNSCDHPLSSVTASGMGDAADEPAAEIPVEADAPRLEMGDHVFRRRAAGLAQIHAIVVSMAPGEDGPLLLADFTGQNVVGEDDDDDNDDDEEDERAGKGQNEERLKDHDEPNEAKKKVAVEEEPPDPTIERVRIICIEGKKNIRKWKKVRYGGSRFGSWFKRKNKDNANGCDKTPETPKRSKSTVEDGSVSCNKEDISSSTYGSAPTAPSRATSARASDVTSGESSSEYDPSKSTNDIAAEDDERKVTPQQQTPKAKEARDKKKYDDLPETDPGTLVVERVNFLLENQNLIPPWHALKSNSECLAVWCKTGRWSTYSSFGLSQHHFHGPSQDSCHRRGGRVECHRHCPSCGVHGLAWIHNPGVSARPSPVVDPRHRWIWHRFDRCTNVHPQTMWQTMGQDNN